MRLMVKEKLVETEIDNLGMLLKKGDFFYDDNKLNS